MRPSLKLSSDFKFQVFEDNVLFVCGISPASYEMLIFSHRQGSVFLDNLLRSTSVKASLDFAVHDIYWPYAST